MTLTQVSFWVKSGTRNSKFVATEMKPGRMMQDPDIIALHHTLDLITFKYYSTNGRVLTRLK